MSDQDDAWEQVAKAALEQAKALAAVTIYAPMCPLPECHQPISLTEHGTVKVHFAKASDVRPCPKSFQPLVPKPPKQPSSP